MNQSTFKSLVSNKTHYFLFALFLAIAIAIGGKINDKAGVSQVEPARAQIDVPTTTGINNVSPVITATVSDGGSASATPTNVGSNVTFTTTANDINSHQYYLAACKTDAVTAGNDAAPTCDGGSWAISTATNSDSQASVAYTTLIGDADLNAWYAFVCDKVTGGGACYPANANGDQGSALGTVVFSGIPVDGATVTIDSVTYEFDTADNGISSGTEIDSASSQGAADVADALVAAETGASSHMVSRGGTVYVYADTEGVGGNSIALAEAGDTGTVIALSGANLAGGSADNASPFIVNHVPTFGTVAVTDNAGGVINPGDTLRFTLAQADIADADTSGGQDTLNMYICTDATTAFDYGNNSCTGGALICSDTAVNPTTTDATCDETGNTLVPTTDTRSTENFKVYVEDNHNYPGTGTNAQSYNIVNSAPTHDDPEVDVHAATLPNSVGYWQFEDGLSATAFDDEASNANDGSCTTCPDWTAEGYSGGAYDFNGSDDVISVPDSNDFSFTDGTGNDQPFSVFAWINLDQLIGGGDMIMAKYDAATNNREWYMQYNQGTGGLDAVMTLATSYGDRIGRRDTSFATSGAWAYVGFTYDGSEASSGIDIYVDGVVADDTDFNAGTYTGMTNGTASLTIGDDSGAGGNFEGKIDEPHIYNRALTADEISQIYAAYTGPQETNLVSHWSFNDGPDGYTQALNYNVEGNWDTNDAVSQSVIKDGNTYKMWYSGYDSTNYRILYTTSTNGTTWTTPVQALSNNVEGSWDTTHAGSPSVIKDGDTYKMWYSGYDGTNYRILYTTSTNGTTWTTPVQALNINQEGNWDTTDAAAPSVIKDGTTYKMWYNGSNGSNWRILYTTSTNGTTWTTPVQALSNNVEGSWDTTHAGSPSVIKDGSTYKMWYDGNNGVNFRILYTTSTNGTTWTTPVQALNYNQEGNWDTFWADNPSVIKEGNTYKMWYNGHTGTNYRILYTKINYDDEFGANDAVMGGGIAPTLATGYYGKAVDFNGTSDYISVPHNSSHNIQDNLTLSAWVKKEGSCTNNCIIVMNQNASTGGEAALRYALVWRTDGTNDISFSFNTGSWSDVVITTSSIEDNTWYHVTGTYDGTTAKIYLNGVLDNSELKSGQILATTGGTIEIGRETAAASEYFNGKIDEVRIYDNDLTASEVQNLYYASKYHDSNQDLSCKALTLDDHDSDTMTTIFNWEKDGTPITVLNMPFDSNVTSTTAAAVLDYSGSANHGQLGAGTAGYVPTWSASGKKGGAYDFDGTDDYIEIANDQSLDFTDNFTLEAWVRPDSTASYNPVFSRGSGDADDFEAYITAGGFFVTVDRGNGGNLDWTPLFNNPTISQWNHIVLTYSGFTLKYYLNGVLDGTDTGLQNPEDTNKPWRIGWLEHSAFGTTDHFDGVIDEVRMYDSVLSAEQIAQNYNNGKPSYNTIVNQETAEADVSWECKAVINDAQSINPDSITNTSNTISPNNSAPVQAVPSSRAHALLDANSVGYWQFEDGDITSSILDETTNSNDGSCTNCPTWTAEGAIGGGYDFDGTNDVISGSDSVSLSVTGDLTVGGWIKLGAIDTEQTITSKWDETTANNDRSYRLWIDSSNNLNFSVSTDGSTVVTHTGTTTTFTTGTWYHVIATYDNAGTMDVYVDGSSDATQKSSGVPASIDDNISNLYVGAKENTSGTTDTYFDGLIDEPHTYDRALSATEIANLYSNTSYVYATHDLGVGGRKISDADSDSIFATVDWRESDTSIAVLNMSFNESITSTAADAVLDYSSYANHGQLGAGTVSVAPTWTNATTCGNNSGGCYSFDGDDLILLPPSEFLNTDTTATMWFKTTTAEVDVALWIGKFNDVNNRFIIYFPGDGKVGTYIKNSGGEVNVFSNSTVNDGNWHYLAAINDGTGSSIYIDGVKQTDVDATVARLSQIATPTTTYIGFQHILGATYPFNGSLDEVQIYDRALTAEQITANYNVGKPNYQGIAYGETTIGETWSANVTFTEGNSESSTTIESNDVEILGFSVDASDGSSSTTTPTNVGSDVTFTGTASVAGTSQWYLAICKTDAVTAGNDAAPTCDGGSWAISTATTDGSQATATYTALVGDAESNAWYAFACDKVASTATCSTSNQGTGDSGSPFVVNHAGTFDSVLFSDYPAQLLTDGDMETAGTTAWTVLSNATLSKQTTSPHGGTNLLRVAYNATPVYYAYQNVTTIGRTYRATGYARSAGVDVPNVSKGSALIWTGTNSTSWQSFDVTFVATGSYVYLGSQTGVSDYVEFDDVIVAEVNPTQLLTDGDMETGGTAAWTGIRATVAKTSTTPHAGTQALRITGTDTSPYGEPASATTTIGEVYRITGWARGDGTAAPSLWDNGFIWSGTSSTSWQSFDVVYTAAFTKPRFYTALGQYVDIDDVIVSEIGTIEPGETVKFTLPKESLSDSNGDTMNMYICSGETDMGGVTTAFNYTANTCTGGTLLCSVTGVDPSTTDAVCHDTQSIISVPTAHGTYDVKVYVEDVNSLAATGTATQTFTVEDVAPVSTGYTATDVPAPTAGGSDTVDFSATLTDDNGDNDVTNIKGIFFDDTAAENTCTADENDCYIDTTCTLTSVSTPGTGKTATGIDNALGADCQVTVWFNANASNWDVNAVATDGNGETTFADAGVTISNVSLQGVDVVETSISYGAVEIGGTSASQNISLGNAGNQSMDMLLQGTDLCIGSYSATCPAEFIPRSSQRWHHSDSTFDWDNSATGDGPYPLVETAGTTSGSTGCINHTLRKRDDRTSTSETNQDLVWKLRIPSGQQVGSYYGQVTVSTTSSCGAETCDNTTDDDADGRADCADHHDCDFHPHCMEASLRMTDSDHDPSNNRTLDQSENLIHATFGDGATSTTFPTKQFRPSYSFDGGDYMDMNNTFSTYLTGNQMTLMAWINTTQTTGEMKVIDAVDSSGNGFSLGLSANEVKACNKNDCLVSSGYTPADGVWHHIAVTYESSDLEKIYMDGQVIATQTNAGAQTLTSALDAQIGRSALTSDYFTGEISDVKVFDYAMNLKQIKNLFHELLSLWK